MKKLKGSLLAAAALAFSVGAGGLGNPMPIPTLATESFAATATTPAPAVSATDAAKSSITELLRILNDPALKQPARSDEQIQLLEKTAAEFFDYTEMSRRTLGAEWVKLNDSQKKEFVEAFQKFLSATYAGKLQEGYSGQQVNYLSERLEGDYAEVRTKISYNKAEVPMDYRLMNKDGNWRVYDVVIDGVSIVANYRRQFAKIIKESSYNDLLNQLKVKTQKRAEGPNALKFFG